MQIDKDNRPTHCLCGCGVALKQVAKARPRKWATKGCEHRGRKKGLVCASARRSTDGEGPDRPVLLMDQEAADARALRIAEQMLREGHMVAEVEERFGSRGHLFAGLARKLGVNTRASSMLPVGLPT
jgi:hypothetical protein